MVRMMWVVLGVSVLGYLGWTMREIAPEPVPHGTPTPPVEASPTPVAVEPVAAETPATKPAAASRPRPTPKPKPPEHPDNPTTLPTRVLGAIQAYRALRIDPKLASGTTNRDEDDAFSALLRKKKDALQSLEDQLVPLLNSAQPRQATEAHMALSSAYEEMGLTLRESPVPSYLGVEQSKVYSETLESMVRVQIDKAIAAAESAKETAAAFPEDHPIHRALQQRIRALASER